MTPLDLLLHVKKSFWSYKECMLFILTVYCIQVSSPFHYVHMEFTRDTQATHKHC